MPPQLLLKLKGKQIDMQINTRLSAIFMHETIKRLVLFNGGKIIIPLTVMQASQMLFHHADAKDVNYHCKTV